MDPIQAHPAIYNQFKVTLGYLRPWRPRGLGKAKTGVRTAGKEGIMGTDHR